MAKHKTNADGFALVLNQITKADLARRLGITRQAVDRWGGEVPERFAVRVAAITNIPAEKILPETYRAARHAAAQRA